MAVPTYEISVTRNKLLPSICFSKNKKARCCLIQGLVGDEITYLGPCMVSQRNREIQPVDPMKQGACDMGRSQSKNIQVTNLQERVHHKDLGVAEGQDRLRLERHRVRRCLRQLELGCRLGL